MNQRATDLLCVDDDQESLELRQLLLEAAGFHVLTASSGVEGLALFQSHTVDAVIVDFQMPGMNGGEVATAMKSLKPEVPVMVLSALPWLPADAPKCIDAFVTKGEPTAKLIDQIERLLPAAGRAAQVGAKALLRKTLGAVAGNGRRLPKGRRIAKPFTPLQKPAQ
jgi:CheY-like chemotaxis protein